MAQLGRIGVRFPARLALAALAVFTPPSVVQAQATLGPAFAYHDDFKLGIGAALNVPIQEFGQRVAILADFFYYFFFPDGDSTWGAARTSRSETSGPTSV